MTPTANVLIFDGDCGFCTSAANFVVARSSMPIEAVAWQLRIRRLVIGLGKLATRAASVMTLVGFENGHRRIVAADAADCASPPRG